jgi:hypothetical protein
MAQLGKCPVCKGGVASDAESCPHCGHRREANYGSAEKRDCPFCDGRTCSKCKNGKIEITPPINHWTGKIFEGRSVDEEYQQRKQWAQNELNSRGGCLSAILALVSLSSLFVLLLVCFC